MFLFQQIVEKTIPPAPIAVVPPLPTTTTANTVTPDNNAPSITTPQVVPPISVASLVAKYQPPVTTAALPVNIVKPVVASEKPPSLSPLPLPTIIPSAIPPLKSEAPSPPPEKIKPHIISPISTYTDPLEQSLASLEHDIKHSNTIDAVTASTILQQMPTTISNPIVPIQNSNIITSNLNHPILQPSQMGMDLKAPIMGPNVMPVNPLIHNQIMEPQNNQPNMLHSQNNGFGIKNEFEIGNNNNGFPQVGLPLEMSISSMFEPFPLPINNQNLKNEAQIKLEESIGIINEKKPPLDPKIVPQNFGNFKPNKQEQNVKNASSWSSLAKGKSPQNNTPGGSSKQQVMDSFKAFQNKAKEKADREKQRLENLELKRQQKEQAERERLRAENERRREREEEDALEKAR